MTSPQQRLDIDRVMRVIDAPKAIVVLIAEDGTPETAWKGMHDEKEMFWLMHQIMVQLAGVVFESLTPQERQIMQQPLVLPTLEQARQLGIVKKGGRR